MKNAWNDSFGAKLFKICQGSSSASFWSQWTMKMRMNTTGSVCGVQLFYNVEIAKRIVVHKRQFQWFSDISFCMSANGDYTYWCFAVFVYKSLHLLLSRRFYRQAISLTWNLNILRRMFMCPPWLIFLLNSFHVRYLWEFTTRGWIFM